MDADAIETAVGECGRGFSEIKSADLRESYLAVSTSSITSDGRVDKDAANALMDMAGGSSSDGRKDLVFLKSCAFSLYRIATG